MAHFGPAQTAKLSLHARHLLNNAEATRDYAKIGSAVFVAGMVYVVNAINQGAGGLVIGAGLTLAVTAGYAAYKIHQHVRSEDAKIQDMARCVGHDEVGQSSMGMLDLDAVKKVVAHADKVCPDLVRAVAQRRERRWDAVLEPDYRPPPRLPRAGS